MDRFDFSFPNEFGSLCLGFDLFKGEQHPKQKLSMFCELFQKLATLFWKII